MSPYGLTLVGVVWFLCASVGYAQDSGNADPLFQSSDILEVRIVAPVHTLRSKRSTTEDVDGKFQFTNEAMESVEVDVGIRTRGRFRHDKKICPFPPIRLNFKTSQNKQSLLHKQDKLKLVAHCRDSSRSEQTMLREYVAYRILNELTDVSFRVRLMRITYVDTDGRDKDRIRYGFVIESKDRLAKRLGISALDIEQTNVSSLRPDYTNLIFVFHYLIGNTDFSAIAGAEDACCHNHELLGNEGELLYSIPYDFDQSGLVDASYAAPNPQFRIRDVRQRLYRGRCQNNEQLNTTIALYNEKRETILKLIGEQQGLDKRSLRTMSSYVEKFYKTINTPKHVQRQLVKKCV